MNRLTKWPGQHRQVRPSHLDLPRKSGGAWAKRTKESSLTELAEPRGRLLVPEQGVGARWPSQDWQESAAGGSRDLGQKRVDSLGRYGEGRPHHLTLGSRKEGCCSHLGKGSPQLLPGWLSLPSGKESQSPSSEALLSTTGAAGDRKSVTFHGWKKPACVSM